MDGLTGTKKSILLEESCISCFMRKMKNGRLVLDIHRWFSSHCDGVEFSYSQLLLCGLVFAGLLLSCPPVSLVSKTCPQLALYLSTHRFFDASWCQRHVHSWPSIFPLIASLMWVRSPTLVVRPDHLVFLCLKHWILLCVAHLGTMLLIREFYMLCWYLLHVSGQHNTSHCSFHSSLRWWEFVVTLLWLHTPSGQSISIYDGAIPFKVSLSRTWLCSTTGGCASASPLSYPLRELPNSQWRTRRPNGASASRATLNCVSSR